MYIQNISNFGRKNLSLMKNFHDCSLILFENYNIEQKYAPINIPISGSLVHRKMSYKVHDFLKFLAFKLIHDNAHITNRLSNNNCQILSTGHPLVCVQKPLEVRNLALTNVQLLRKKDHSNDG